MGNPRYRAIISQQLCIGCGLCEETLPDVFQLGDYNASVVVPSIAAENLDALRTAVRDCPVEAISIAPLGATDSGHSPDDDNEKRENEEQDGEIREYKRKHSDLTDRDEIEPHDAEALQRGEHNFTVVRNGTDDN